MSETINRLNITWGNLSSYNRIQLLKATELLDISNIETAQAAIHILKMDKAICAQLLSLLAEKTFQTQHLSGLDLFEQAIVEADDCWLKSDKIRSMGVLIECLCRCKLRKKSRIVIKKTLSIIDSINITDDIDPEQTDQSVTIIESLSDLALNFFRSQNRHKAKYCLKIAIAMCKRLSTATVDHYQIKMIIVTLLSQRLAQIRYYKLAIHLAKQITSTTFNGFEYYNYELTKAQLFGFIATCFTNNRKRRQAKQTWLTAAKIIITDVHDDDQLRAAQLNQIAKQLDLLRYSQKARKLRNTVQEVLETDNNPKYNESVLQTLNEL